MSSELKLPSHIYEESPHHPIVNQNPKEKPLSLDEVNTKLDKCLINQINIILSLEKLAKKLEEFE
jgi:hypothetical protein